MSSTFVERKHQYVGGRALVICNYYAVSHKGLEQLQILVPVGGPGTNAPDTEGQPCKHISFIALCFIALHRYCNFY